MSRVAKQVVKSPVPDWETLRPRVTEPLLADVARRIVQNFRPEKIVLFGSYAYGTPERGSDLDLLH